MLDEELIISIEKGPDANRGIDMGRGFIASLGLHGGVLLAIVLSLLWAAPKPREQPRIFMVNLVRFAASMVVPAATKGAPTGNETSENAVSPVAAVKTVGPRNVPPTTEPKALTVPVPKIWLLMATGAPSIVLPPPPRFEPRPQPNVEDKLAARLRMFAHLREPAVDRPSDDPGLNGTRLSELSANGIGHDATSAVKDFIRAQVERRWILDRREIGAKEWVVKIHIVLARNGQVRRAEIVDTGGHTSDANYLDFARSARNAVWVSSPLSWPPGMYSVAHDIVVDFDLREAAR